MSSSLNELPFGHPYSTSGVILTFWSQRLLRRAPQYLALLTTLGLGAIVVEYQARLEGLQLIDEDIKAENLRVAASIRKETTATSLTPKFPSLNSADAVRMLSNIANESNLMVDEITYQLVPLTTARLYRYKASLVVNSDYFALRSFISKLNAASTNSSIENITCRRRSTPVPPLSCNLTISIFFSQDEQHT